MPSFSLIISKVKEYYEKIGSSNYFYFLIVIIGALLLSGLTFSIVRKSPIAIGFTVIFPRNYFQTQMETIIVALGYLSGFTGVYLIYSARKRIHNQEYVNMVVIMGTFLILFSSFLLWTLSDIKR